MYWTTRKLTGRLTDSLVDNWRALILIPVALADEVRTKKGRGLAYRSELTYGCHLDLWRETNGHWHARILIEGQGLGNERVPDLRIAIARTFRSTLNSLTYAYGPTAIKSRPQVMKRLREGLALAESRLTRAELKALK